jgi:hypothetical protein
VQKSPAIANGRTFAKIDTAHLDPENVFHALQTSGTPRFVRAASLISEARKCGVSIAGGAWFAQYVCKLAAEMYARQRTSEEYGSAEFKRLDDLARDAFVRRVGLLQELGLLTKARAVFGKRTTPMSQKVFDVIVTLADDAYPKLVAQETDLVEQLDFVVERFYCGVLPSALKGRVLLSSAEASDQQAGHTRMRRTHVELLGLLVRLRALLDHSYLRVMVTCVYSRVGVPCTDVGFPCPRGQADEERVLKHMETDRKMGKGDSVAVLGVLIENQVTLEADKVVIDGDQVVWKDDWKDFGAFLMSNQVLYGRLRRLVDRYKHENLDVPDEASLRVWLDQPDLPADDLLLVDAEFPICTGEHQVRDDDLARVGG